MSENVKGKRILQVVPSYTLGDAVGNEVTAMDKALREAGIETAIYADVVDPRLQRDGVFHRSCLVDVQPDDVLIYHMCIACDFVYSFAELPCVKVMVYHNVTPPEFYKRSSIMATYVCSRALDQVKFLSDKVDYCIADSEWNKHDLVEFGFTCPIMVLPVMIPFEDYRREPSASVIDRYAETPGANIMFAGRVVRNKCQHDIVKAFYYYKRDYDPDAKLFIVGGFSPLDPYYLSLVEYIQKIGVDDVIIPGHIPFDEILAYYEIADVFLSMSEHEGFCVPLVEAMLFETPIVAFDSTAISQTLGDGGVLLKEKDALVTAGVLNRVVKDEDLRSSILEGQKRQLDKFCYTGLNEQFLTIVNTIVGVA